MPCQIKSQFFLIFSLILAFVFLRNLSPFEPILAFGKLYFNQKCLMFLDFASQTREFVIKICIK